MEKLDAFLAGTVFGGAVVLFVVYRFLPRSKTARKWLGLE